MKILVVGASGTIGKKVKEELEQRHEVISAGRSSGDVRVDLTDSASIEQMFRGLGDIDACIITALSGSMNDFQSLTEADFGSSLKGKLMGQINVVLIGQHYLKYGGSFTLTSGILGEDPARDCTVGAVVSGGLNSFVLAAARELQRGLRINVVSPGVVADSYKELKPYFPGFYPVPMDKVVHAYLKSAEGIITGQILRVYV